MGVLFYFLLIAILFAVMMSYGCGSHVMGHRRSRHDDAPPGKPPEKAVDPVCGMTVETATAKTSVRAGRTHYFCSTGCRDKFEAAPEKYAGAPPIPPSMKEKSHASHNR